MEMVYEERKNRLPIVLSRGIYKGYEYVILSLYSHPTAYILLDENHKWYGKDYFDIPLEVHGGLTYGEKDLGGFLEYSDKYKCENLTVIRNKWVIGWDYAHYGDYYYSRFMSETNDKKWTTEEILQEVKKAIDEMIE